MLLQKGVLTVVCHFYHEHVDAMTLTPLAQAANLRLLRED